MPALPATSEAKFEPATNFANNKVAAEWPWTGFNARPCHLPLVRQNKEPLYEPCRPTRYQNPFASRQALKAAVTEDARPNRVEPVSDPAAISSGALGIGTPACWSR